MKVLVACEFSGIVRDAFIARGHRAMSCDLLPSERLGFHLQCDVLKPIAERLFDWDLLIAHPPCTYLTNSGVRWLYQNGRGTERDPKRWREMRRAVEFFNALLAAKIPRICIENPIQHGYARALITSQHTQIIQPWQFGHNETKATCLWLKDLPPLVATKIMPAPHNARVHMLPPGPNRWKERSRTLQGIADAMAEQWGSL